jgi:hypothetical protein
MHKFKLLADLAPAPARGIASGSVLKNAWIHTELEQTQWHRCDPSHDFPHISICVENKIKWKNPT